MLRITSIYSVWMLVCAMTLPFPIAQAATGLSSLAVFAWAAWFFVAVGAVALLAGLVVIARFIRWKLIADQPQVDVRGKVVPFVLSTTSVLGAPVFLFAFALDDPQTRWIFSVLFYAVLLTLTVLVLTRSWKLALIVVGITIPAYLVRLSGTVALTEYVVIDSLPFEPSHLVAGRYSSQFLRTDDGDPRPSLREINPGERDTRQTALQRICRLADL